MEKVNISVINKLQMENEYQYLGTISSPNGFKGKLNVKDLPEGIDKLRRDSEILCGFSPNFSKKYTLKEFSRKQTKATIILLEINSDKDAFALKEKGIFTRKSNLESDEKTTLTDDLIGLKVIEESTQKQIGRIVDVWYLPGNDVWVCETEKGDLPLPVIDDVILNVDLEKELIHVNIIDGLWDLVSNDLQNQ